MPDFVLQYVYALGDFNTAGPLDAVPDEQGAQAQGSPPWQLQLNAGVTPQQVTVTDDDPDFNEIGGNDQALTNDVTIDGVFYPAGSTIIINYVLTTADGFEGYSITIGSNNNGGNTTTAFITNEPMIPGQTYEFVTEGNIGNNSIPYAEFACFTTGTLIRTPNGPRLIDDLEPGDMVQTYHHGPLPIIWIGRRQVMALGKKSPILVRAGTLGATADLLVSPNHRMLLTGALPELIVGASEVLVPAKALTNDTTICQTTNRFVTYVHIMFAQHEVVWANDSPSESFFVGDQALGRMDREQYAELLDLFPELGCFSGGTDHRLACLGAKTFEGRVFAADL